MADDDPVAAYLLASTSDNIVFADNTTQFVQLARACLALGSVTLCRQAYHNAAAAAAAATRPEQQSAIDIEQQQLETLIANWIDHPMRLQNLFFRTPRHRTPPSLPGVSRVDVSVTTNQLAVSIFCTSSSTSTGEPPPPPPRALVYYFHGNGECADDLAQLSPRFHALGLALAVVEMRGYGRRCDETPSLSMLLSDAEHLLSDEARESIFAAAGDLPRTTPILCFGRSIGSHPAVHACAMSVALGRPTWCAGLVLDSAVASVRHWQAEVPNDDGGDAAGRPPVPGGMRTVGILENRAKISALAAARLPMLILHGTADQLVPPFQAICLHQHSQEQSTLQMFENCGHNDLMHAPGYWPAVAALVETALQGREKRD